MEWKREGGRDKTITCLFRCFGSELMAWIGGDNTLAHGVFSRSRVKLHPLLTGNRDQWIAQNTRISRMKHLLSLDHVALFP